MVGCFSLIKNPQLVSAMPPPCSNVESESAPAQVSVLHCPPVSRAKTGESVYFMLCWLQKHRIDMDVPRFLIWIGSDQEKTFGPTITGLIHKHIEPERMILWDSKKRGGRPDTVKLLQETWDGFGAEVIFITSNKTGNDEMMQGCRAGTRFPDFGFRKGLSLICYHSWYARVRYALGFLKSAKST